MPLINARRQWRQRRRWLVPGGFTLVELLVVIGIIALLIAILLPALSRARESANMLKCQATLRSMAQAAHGHAAEHQGYMPLAAVQQTYPMAAGMNDPLQRRYTYFLDESNIDQNTNSITADAPAPLSAALGRYMNLSVDLTSRKKLQASLREESLIRFFSCPSDTNPPTPGSTVAVNGSISWRTPDEVMSYIVNGNMLGGGRDLHPDLVPAGKVSKVRHPSEVFLFADGKRGPEPQVAYEVLCVTDYWQNGTLYDYWDRGGGGPDSSSNWPKFDYDRHRGRANVVFVDGHVETITLPDYRTGGKAQLEQTKSDFEHVGVSKGIYQ
jgi:prepilin-type processing-associated H-X9-DG protein/prepilin-type N-terminal cleavage/methylation domain-containing protein